jgi:hypothetical protein
MVRSYLESSFAHVFGEYQHDCRRESARGRGILTIKVILDEEGRISVVFEFL